MLSNYNLFNDDKVDDLTSTFLEMKCCQPSTMEKYIIELINYYSLEMYCNNISFSDSNPHRLGLYNNKQKELLINYKEIIKCLEKISVDDYFITANVYRIILHEIKHILQHKMIQVKDNKLFQLFQNEFFNGSKDFISPSEVNADIESSLVIAKNYNKNHYLYDKQLIFSSNLINSFHIPKCIVSDYCKNNKIQFLTIDLDLFNRFVYGFDTELIDHKKTLIKKY